MSRIRQLLCQHAPGALVDRRWPLTPFEKMMVLEDRADYPLDFEVLLRFEGPLDPDAMRDAWQFAAGRHPLLRSTIKSDAGRLTWNAPANDWAELSVASNGRAAASERLRVCLKTIGGLAGSLTETAEGWDLRLLFHHACCDGHGARMFLQDLVLAYVVLRGASVHANPFFRADIAQLERRGDYSHVRGPDGGPWRRLSKTLFRTARFALRRARPTAAEVPQAAGSGRANGSVLGMCSHTFSAEEVARMHRSRQEHSATFNDLATAMLFDVLGDWQRGHGVGPHARVRIAVPADLRSREDERMPATNRYTYLFLDRRVEQCGPWAAMLGDVQRDLQELRNSGRGMEFLNALRWAARHDRLLAWIVRRDICFSTAVLTNLGDPSWRLRKRLHVDAEGLMWLDAARCVDIQIRTPPLRPGTRWGVGISEYAGRMSLSVRYDSTAMTPAAARDVFGDYLTRWHALCDDGSPHRRSAHQPKAIWAASSTSPLRGLPES